MATSTNQDGKKEPDSTEVPYGRLTEDEFGNYDSEANKKGTFIYLEIDKKVDRRDLSSLGFTIIDVMIKEKEFDERPVFVNTVKEGGIAAKAGLQVDDEIWELDGGGGQRYTRPYMNYYLRNLEKGKNLQIEAHRLPENGPLKTRVTSLIQQAREQEKKLLKQRKVANVKNVGDWKSTELPDDKTTVHLHFLDHDTSYVKNTGVETEIVEPLREKLISLHSIENGGILVYWGGRNEGEHPNHSIVADALTPLLKDPEYKDSGFQCESGGSITVAVPLNQQMEQKGGWCDGAPTHHVLLQEDSSQAHSSQAASSHFQKALMDDSLSKKKPTVCVVVNGGVEVLRLACAAMERGIPVVVLKDTGGVAELFESLDKKTYNKKSINGLMERSLGKNNTVKQSDKDLVLELFKKKKPGLVTICNIEASTDGDKLMQTVEKEMKDRGGCDKKDGGGAADPGSASTAGPAPKP